MTFDEIVEGERIYQISINHKTMIETEDSDFTTGIDTIQIEFDSLDEAKEQMNKINSAINSGFKSVFVERSENKNYPYESVLLLVENIDNVQVFEAEEDEEDD